MGAKMVDTDNGYTKIANELLEAIISHPFSKRELNIVLALIRKTYGYHKKSDAISMSQLAKLSGITRQHVNETVNELKLKNIIIENGESIMSHGMPVKSIGLNKHYSQWLTSPKTGLVPKQDASQNSVKTSPKTGTRLVPKQDTQKITPKEITKEIHTGSRNSPVPMFNSWIPGKTNMDWMNDAGVPAPEIEKIIRDFRDYWMLAKTKRSNWDLSFRKNPLVQRAVNTAAIKQQKQTVRHWE